MLQQVIINKGGTIHTVFVGRPQTTCNLAIYGTDGSTVLASTPATVDPVNTTISAVAYAGDRTLTLTSGTGVAVRRRYLLGDEEVSLKSFNGASVTLWAPLERDHAALTTFQGLRCSYTIAAGVPTAETFDLQAVWTPGSGDEQTEIVDFVVRKIPDPLISEVDLRKIVPKDVNALSADLDMHEAISSARHELLIDLGTKRRVSHLLGTDHLRRLAAIRFWLDRRWEFGDGWSPQMDALQTEYDESVAQTLAESPEGTATGGAQSPTTEGVTFGFPAGWL